MENAVHKEPNEIAVPMTGVEKIHYASMRTITRNFSVIACLLWDKIGVSGVLLHCRGIWRQSVPRRTLVVKRIPRFRLEEKPPRRSCFKTKSAVGLEGIDDRLMELDDFPGPTISAIECAQRLGGMLRFYRRAAA